MPFDFWKFADPDELRKQQAQDVIENARKMREEADRSEIQQHIGGILESFQRDVTQRMEPLTSRFNSYAQQQPAAPPPPSPSRPAPQPEESPVDRVMNSFSKAWEATKPQALRPGTEEYARSQKTRDVADQQPAAWGRSLGHGIANVEQGLDAGKELLLGGALPVVGRVADELTGTSTIGDMMPGVRETPVVGDMVADAKPIQMGIGLIPLPGRAGKVVNAIGASGIAAAGPASRAAGAATNAAQAATSAAASSAGASGFKIAGGAFQKAAGPVVRGAAQQKVAASYGQATPGVDLGIKDWKYKLFDDLAPVQGVMDGLEKAFGRKLADSENAYEILRLGRASAEIGDAWYRNHVGDVLERVQNVSGSVAQGRADLNDYLRAKDAIDKAAANPGRNFGGMTKADAEQALYEMQARLGPNFAELEKGAEQFYKLGDFLLDRKVQAGLVSVDDANALKAMYPHYMPIQVIDWLDDNLAKTSTRMGKVGGGANDIKKLTELGTDRQAEEPLQAFYRAAERTAMLSAKNEAANAIVKASQNTPYLQGLIRPADNAAAKLSGMKTQAQSAYARKPGESELRIKVGGQDATFYVDRALEPLVSFGTTMDDNFFKKVFSPVADLTRKASIAYNPVWGAGQLVMDSLSFLIREGGLGDPKALGRNVGYLAEGVKQAATKGNVYKIASEAGALPGTIDHVSGRAGSYDKVVRGMTGRDITSPKEFAAWVKDNALGGLSEFNQRLDAVPRLAEFSRSMDAGKSLQKSALAARDITIDPSRGGALVKQVNAVVPFFNVAFQGAAYTPRMLRNPETRNKAMTGITSSVILPTMALEYLNQQDPRYKDVPDFDKDRGFIIMNPLEKGKIDPSTGVERPAYFLVRTGPFTPFVTLGRAMYNSATGQDVDMYKTGRALMKQQMPFDVTPIAESVRSGEGFLPGAMKSTVPLLPAGVRQGVEAYSNFDTFRDRPIVPKGLENQPLERQFTNETSETAKFLGPKIGVAPAKLDYFLKAWGGAADTVVDVFDAAGQGATTAIKATTGLETGFGSSGESQRLIKLRAEAEQTGLTDEERATLNGEIERELAIKADRDSAVRNTPVVGQLAGRYYRQIGAQSVEDRAEAIDRALLEKKRDTSEVGKELSRLGVTFGDVKGSIGGVTLTRESAATYRENAMAYRERLLSDLVKQDFYKQADDKQRERYISDVMQRGAGWAASQVAKDNPSLLEKVTVGTEFVSDQIGQDVDVASRRFMGALKAKADLEDQRASSRYVNVSKEEYDQVARDRAELSQYKSILGDREAEMVFMSRHGADRLARAKNARESKFWDSHVERFKRDNPDYALFIESAPKVITRRGLDAQSVARLAGL